MPPLTSFFFSSPLYGLTGIDLELTWMRSENNSFALGPLVTMAVGKQHGQDAIHFNFRVLQTMCFQFAQKYFQQFDKCVDLDESLWHVVMGNFCNTHGSIKT